METNFERLKKLDASDFAYAVVVDKDGENRASCAICQRYYEDNCDDRCLCGVYEYLMKEVNNDKN